MSLESTSTAELLTTLGEIKTLLRERNVIRSERLTGEIGEWLAQIAYQATPAPTCTQRGFDLRAGNDRLQIKSHARGDNNPHRSTEINPNRINDFERLIITIMSPKYKIEEWFDVPNNEVQRVKKIMGKKKPQTLIFWNHIKEFKIDLRQLPGFNEIQGHIADNT